MREKKGGSVTVHTQEGKFRVVEIDFEGEEKSSLNLFERQVYDLRYQIELSFSINARRLTKKGLALWIPGAKNIADIFTKNLSGPQFEEFAVAFVKEAEYTPEPK